MSRSICMISLLTALALDSHAFVPTSTSRPALSLSSSSDMDGPYFADIKDASQQALPAAPHPVTKKDQPKKKKVGGAIHKKGVFSPVVYASKVALGEEKLNKLRAKVISLHGDVIAGFVDTSDSAVGNLVLQQLFEITDKDNSGTIEEEELHVALRALGFNWLKEKQVKGIFARADKDANGAIDLNEWMKEAPKTLRTNLTKLAKKNGGEMGLLV